ncbi:MAG: hypothetical protein C0473_00525 [Cyanobacteria bacterium DS3.002]|nr:hypothetical protein [Cyanobacteria bacterium DS3.002]MBA4075025.1 hypothetical protein [Cyanobacteria bacterium PR.023]
MTNRILTKKQPAFNLFLGGAVGSFAVKTSEGSSIPVKYIQTHVKFKLDDPQYQRIFDCLRPVREIFNEKTLGFEDLMQRDIDDARVSNQLIPYLLLPASGDEVKFFPPIVTVVVPVDADLSLLPLYPKIENEIIEETGYNLNRIRSGPVGSETFEFEQVQEEDGELNSFDNARLRLNTSKCQLVIVDGQHRAMALLALYRNIRKWPDGTSPFAKYYERWTNENVSQDLSELSLPMVVCTFPSLDETSTANTKVSTACRSVFLALNKNARPVTKSRNILLDDRDFIALCERSILEQIKDENDSEKAVRLCNFELDADEDKSALKSTLAISGVMHIFSAIERVLLNTDEPIGLHYPKRNYSKINRGKFADSCLQRLNARNLIGSDRYQKTERNSVAHEAAKILENSFNERYGKYFKRLLQEFAPYEAAGLASLELEREIDSKEHHLIKKMLYEGQGIQRVFNQYVKDIENDFAEKYSNQGKEVPKRFKDLVADFKQTQKRLTEFQADYLKKRTDKLMPRLVSKMSSNPAVYDELNSLYRWVLTSTAFQNALLITFFSTIEKLNDSRGSTAIGDSQDDAVFEEYLSAINSFFRATTEAELHRILSGFQGKVIGELSDGSLRVNKTNSNIRSLAFQSLEQKPDEWPKWRYIILEIWKRQKTNNSALAELLSRYVDKCRAEMLKTYVGRETTLFCRNLGIAPSDLDKTKRNEIARTCLENYVQAIQDIGVRLLKEDKAKLEKCLEEPTLLLDEEVDESEAEDETATD